MPLALALGVQKAKCIASTVLFVVVFQAMAVSNDVPINKTPELTDLITNPSTVPSKSLASLWVFRLSKLMVI